MAAKGAGAGESVRCGMAFAGESLHKDEGDCSRGELCAGGGELQRCEDFSAVRMKAFMK